ncbi:peptidase inhibitor family I36 protein [Streptomyces sp. NPDC047928]|uniref:peptidase inhibitor family I36 protein n=1 Tax=unclassified Streptomyces TaxID=2593676 RepID=UPI0037225A86
MRKRTLGIIAAAGSLIFATATPASAEANPPGCPKGYFCAYSGWNQTGTLKLKTAGNWSGSVSGIGSIFNNGHVYPGYDHVQVSFGSWSECYHYNPGPGDYKANFLAPYPTITKVVWRGEC